MKPLKEISLRSTWNVPVYLVFLSLMLFASRDTFDAIENPIDASNLHRVGAILLALMLLFSHFFRSTMPRRITSVQRAYFFYLLVASVSIMHSDLPMFSLFKLAEVATVFLLSIYVIQFAENNTAYAHHFFDLVIRFYKLLILAAAVGVAIFPQNALRSPLGEASLAIYGKPLIPYQISGVIVEVNANSLGAMAAILLFTSLIRSLSGRRDFFSSAWCFISIVILVFSQSRTAFTGFACAMIVAILFVPKLRRSSALFLLFVGLCFIGIFYDYVYEFVSRGVELKQLLKLSGRTDMWELAMSEFSTESVAKQLLGLGFMVGNRMILLNQLQDEGTTTLHSDYVDALITTGYIGASILVLALFFLFRQCVRSLTALAPSPFVVELTGAAVILAVRTFTGPTISSHNFFLPMFFAISIGLHLSFRRSKEVKGVQRLRSEAR